jgi:hypothetical protein
MDGIPASEIAKSLGITPDAVKMRFKRRNIKPFKYIGPTGLYKESDIEAIKDAYLGKHPVKTKSSSLKHEDAPEPKPEAKAPKT